MEEIVNFLVETIGSMGYLGIFVLMFLESCFFPFPSEVVMIPAGFLAYKGEMNVAVVFAAGLAGSLSGAMFNYFLAATLGRELLHKYGHYVFIKEKTLDKMDLFFKNHGEVSTFNGRLLPGIRQLISLPAGLARMPLIRFCIYTSAGAGIWLAVLIILGYFIGANEQLVREYLNYITIGAIILVVIISVGYYQYKKRPKQTAE